MEVGAKDASKLYFLGDKSVATSRINGMCLYIMRSSASPILASTVDRLPVLPAGTCRGQSAYIPSRSRELTCISGYFLNHDASVNCS